MQTYKPETPEQLAEALATAQNARQGITLGGAFTKSAMGGPLSPAEATVTTSGLKRVLQYEPRDLTISVESGLLYGELCRVLDANRQMIPLDPPFCDKATVGGILAANTCGPRRRLYGSARDMVIGMKFATLEGKLVQSGGMVVKNVAGLDMAKLMIGSFGTLAAIAVANFKLVPKPAASRTFLMPFDSAAASIAARNTILRNALQPAAIDLLNPPASARLGLEGWLLLVQAGGNAAVLERYTLGLPEARPLEGEEETTLWRRVRNFTPDFLAAHPEGAVVRVSATLTELREVIETIGGPSVARAGSGICYGYFYDSEAAVAWMKRGLKAVIEFAPPEGKARLDMWPCPGDDLATMKEIKRMFDPGNLLNRRRLYGRI